MKSLLCTAGGREKAVKHKSLHHAGHVAVCGVLAMLALLCTLLSGCGGQTPRTLVHTEQPSHHSTQIVSWEDSLSEPLSWKSGPSIRPNADGGNMSDLHSTADQRGYLLMAMCYMILVTAWIGSVIGRAMNRNIRWIAILTGLLLIGWAFIRFIRYQLNETGVLSRYCWYGSYLFGLSIPLFMLFLAWTVDKREKAPCPRWLKIGAAINSALFLLVITNDLHGLVFKLNSDTGTWSDGYRYGVGYYLIHAGMLLPILFAVAMLIYKSWKSPHRKAVVFPLGYLLFVFFYGLSYALRVRWAAGTDLTMTIGFSTLLFFESAMRTGMVPVNTRYAELFRCSTLQMQIVDREGVVRYRASDVPNLDRETLRRLFDGGSPIRQGENILLYAGNITGGMTIWREDISDLNRLMKELEDSAAHLRAANTILDKKSEVRSRMLRAEEKSRLFTQLEEEIAGKTELLSQKIRELPQVEGKDHHRAVAGITMLLCYIKRRCNLFFMEREQDTIAVDNVMTWIDELAEYARFTGLPVMTRCAVRSDIPARQSTLFYDFLYAILSWACSYEDENMLEQFGEENDRIVMRLMFPAAPAWPTLDEKFLSAVERAAGVLRRQDLGDTQCILLSFPKRGDFHA